MSHAGIKVVAVGNPFDGTTLFGPFFTDQQVEEFVDTVGSQEWAILSLKAPFRASLDALPGAEGDEPVGLFTGSIEARLTDECLVTIWPNGDVEVAFRSGLESWGPPSLLEPRETR